MLVKRLRKYVESGGLKGSVDDVRRVGVGSGRPSKREILRVSRSQPCCIVERYQRMSGIHIVSTATSQMEVS